MQRTASAASTDDRSTTNADHDRGHRDRPATAGYSVSNSDASRASGGYGAGSGSHPDE
jgi:hypothetical protein